LPIDSILQVAFKAKLDNFVLVLFCYHLTLSNSKDGHQSMRIRHIEVFHAVYTTGSVTNAAKKLYVSQPSVSKVLGHAEQQLGFKLFDRIKGRLTPTKEADLLFDEVDQIYRQLININSAAENIKNNEVGKVSVAVTPALGFDLIPSTFVRFSRGREKISIDVQTVHNDRLLSHLHKHQSDFAVLFSPDKFSGVVEKTLGYGTMVAVYSKKLLPHCPDILTPKELLQNPLVSIWNSGPLADIVWNNMTQQNLKPTSMIKVQTYFIAVSMVRYGAGICIVDEFTAKGQISEGIGIAKLKGIPDFPIKALHLESNPLSKVSKEFITQISKQLNSPFKV